MFLERFSTDTRESMNNMNHLKYMKHSTPEGEKYSAPAKRILTLFFQIKKRIGYWCIGSRIFGLHFTPTGETIGL